MPKYGRPVNHGDSIRLQDIVEVPVGVDADAWLRTMYSAHVEEWVTKGEWFIQAPDNMPLISGAPVVNGQVLPLPQAGQCVVEIAAQAGSILAQGVLAAEAVAAQAETPP